MAWWKSSSSWRRHQWNWLWHGVRYKFGCLSQRWLDRTSCKPMSWQWIWSTCAMTGQRRGIIMASWNLTIILLSDTSQQEGDIILLWESGDCTAARSL
jgi:hypothetical protein